jgi:hypothetical protein
MQRAAAKSSRSTPNGPPAKKTRLSNGSAVGTSDREIIQSGLDAEEAKRQAALDRAAQHAGETKWVLSFKDPLEGKRQDAMNVRQAGFAELDAEDDEDEEEDVKPIRMQFGGGVKKKADVRITRLCETIKLTLARNLYLLSKLKTRIQNPSHPRMIMIQTILQQISFDRRSAKWHQKSVSPKRIARVWATNRPWQHRSDRTTMETCRA